MTQMTLTRALNEVKLTEKKIAGLTDKMTGWTIITKNGKITSSKYDNLDQFESTVKTNKDKVNTLIDYRNKVKRALIAANNITQVTIGGKTMTIADAIDRKAFATTELNLYRKISLDVKNTQNQFDAEQRKVDMKVDDLINTALEGDGKKDPEVVKGIEKSVRENNKFVLEDKNKITQWVETSIEEVEEFLNEVDFVLSEVNAKTTIEID